MLKRYVMLLVLPFVLSDCGNSLSVLDGRTVGPSRIAVTLSGENNYVQFGTKLSHFRNAEDSLFVRPAYPDNEQFIDLKNISADEVRLKDLKIGIPNVTADLVLTESASDDTLLAPGETRRIHLTFAPKADTIQSFSTPSALLIFTDDLEDPLIPIELRGRSTFNADVSYDGSVNFGDLGVLNANMYKDSTSADWDPTADINGDGAINFSDLGMLNAGMGKTVPVLSARRTVRVGAIRTSTGYPDVLTQLEALLAKHPDVDLVLTPEYTFFPLGPVNLSCAGTCQVSSTGTTDSDTLAGILGDLQSKAAAAKINIVLGTVIAGVETEGQWVYDNTALVIDSTGSIVGHHRKMELPDAFAPEVCKSYSPAYSQVECDKLKQPSADSGYPVTLATRDGEYFTIFPMICAELQSYYPHSVLPNHRDHYHYLSGEVILVERLRGTQVDLLAHALASGDIFTDYLTDCIQNGTELPNGVCRLAKNQIQQLYLDEWKDHFGVLRDGGAILSTDLAGAKAGVLETGLRPIAGYDLEPGFLFAELSLPR
jgi:predicted amidohydrolase